MATTSEIQEKLNAAIGDQLAPAAATIDFTSIDDTPTYDPETGLTRSDSSLTGLTGLLVDYTEKEMVGINSVLEKEERIRPTDVKLIITQNILTIEPKKGDLVAVTGGKTYKVIAWIEDPFKVQYEIQLRTMKDA